MMQALRTQIRKLFHKEQALVEPNKTVSTASKATAQVAGIDVNTDQLHMTDGRIFEIHNYMDPYGKVCEPEDACCVEAANGNNKIRVEFYSNRYTLH